jgi:hypothetical protein
LIGVQYRVERGHGWPLVEAMNAAGLDAGVLKDRRGSDKFGPGNPYDVFDLVVVNAKAAPRLCPGCREDVLDTPAAVARRGFSVCCNFRCDGKWGTGCYHCHGACFWRAELARREETYTTIDLGCGAKPGSTSAAADDWQPDEPPAGVIMYSNRSMSAWPIREFRVPHHGDLLDGRIGAVAFSVPQGDGIYLAAAMRAAGYSVELEPNDFFDGPDKLNARLRPAAVARPSAD